MAKPGVIAPLAKQALKDGVSVDELISAHPELDEKALRRGYAQVKSKAGKTKPAGKKKASKKASKKAGKKVGKRVAAAAVAIARELVPADPHEELRRLTEQVTGNTRDIRSFILKHGTFAIRSVLDELES